MKAGFAGAPEATVDQRRDRPLPLNPNQAPPPDRYCDMVLKGGVVDGVVYPWAIVELARAYRFKNISGTSVGAVAAALTAAAEYSRRYGSTAGFDEVLLKVPEELAKPVEGDTRLYSLFQPTPGGATRLFTLFVAFFGKGAKLKGLREAYGRVALWSFVSALFFALCISLLFHLPAACESVIICLGLWLVVLAQCVFNGVVFAAAMVVFSLGRDLLALPDAGFGLCSGLRLHASKSRPGFTDWLHEGIQAAAGRPLDQPLTFADLWHAPGGSGAASRPQVRPSRKPRSIDLRMISTSLSHGRPYGLPLPEDSPPLFFRLDEWREYFPKEVIAFLKKNVPEIEPLPGDLFGAGLRELPRGELPVLVAARMSLSFPVLFKAVPLYAIQDPDPKQPRRMRRCWFADGGICSNFMIHQFDAILPKWPTFGIALEAARDERGLAVGASASVVVTAYHDEGREEVWNFFDPGPPLGQSGHGDQPGRLGRLTGFLLSLMDAAKDWNDNTSMRMAGTRDRIARIRLHGGSESALGGLNLRLSGADIMKMASEYGWVAGRLLVEKFAPEGATTELGSPVSRGWNEHRWVRFQSFVAGLRERIGGFEAAAEEAGYCLPLTEQIRLARELPPLASDPRSKVQNERLTKAQADALQATLEALQALEKSLEVIRTVQPYKPVPPPEMRLRMPL